MFLNASQIIQPTQELSGHITSFELECSTKLSCLEISVDYNQRPESSRNYDVLVTYIYLAHSKHENNLFIFQAKVSTFLEYSKNKSVKLSYDKYWSKHGEWLVTLQIKLGNIVNILNHRNWIVTLPPT